MRFQLCVVTWDGAQACHWWKTLTLNVNKLVEREAFIDSVRMHGAELKNTFFRKVLYGLR